jgi:hypothetical protein
MLMELTCLPERFGAIHTLQAIRGRYRPGSYPFERADLAIDLALNPTRQTGAYLVRNLLRDAARTMRRNRDAVPELIDVDRLPPALEPADQATPENAAPAIQLEAELCRASSNPCLAQRCLDDMIAGRTVHESAAACAVSCASVKKARSRLRYAARRMNWGRA